MSLQISADDYMVLLKKNKFQNILIVMGIEKTSEQDGNNYYSLTGILYINFIPFAFNCKVCYSSSDIQSINDLNKLLQNSIKKILCEPSSGLFNNIGKVINLDIDIIIDNIIQDLNFITPVLLNKLGESDIGRISLSECVIELITQTCSFLIVIPVLSAYKNFTNLHTELMKFFSQKIKNNDGSIVDFLHLIDNDTFFKTILSNIPLLNLRSPKFLIVFSLCLQFNAGNELCRKEFDKLILEQAGGGQKKIGGVSRALKAAAILGLTFGNLADADSHVKTQKYHDQTHVEEKPYVTDPFFGSKFFTYNSVKTPYYARNYSPITKMVEDTRDKLTDPFRNVISETNTLLQQSSINIGIKPLDEEDTSFSRAQDQFLKIFPELASMTNTEELTNAIFGPLFFPIVTEYKEGELTITTKIADAEIRSYIINNLLNKIREAKQDYFNKLNEELGWDPHATIGTGSMYQPGWAQYAVEMLNGQGWNYVGSMSMDPIRNRLIAWANPESAYSIMSGYMKAIWLEKMYTDEVIPAMNAVYQTVNAISNLNDNTDVSDKLQTGVGTLVTQVAKHTNEVTQEAVETWRKMILLRSNNEEELLSFLVNKYHRLADTSMEAEKMLTKIKVNEILNRWESTVSVVRANGQGLTSVLYASLWFLQSNILVTCLIMLSLIVGGSFIVGTAHNIPTIFNIIDGRIHIWLSKRLARVKVEKDRVPAFETALTIQEFNAREKKILNDVHGGAHTAPVDDDTSRVDDDTSDKYINMTLETNTYLEQLTGNVGRYSISEGFERKIIAGAKKSRRRSKKYSKNRKVKKYKKSKKMNKYTKLFTRRMQ